MATEDKKAFVKTELEERKMLLAQLGSGRPGGKVCFVRKETGRTVSLTTADYPQETTLYFHACTDGDYTLDARCTKLLIHQCVNCTFRVVGPVLTHCAEVWKCENVTIDFQSEIRTLQLDMSDGLNIRFARKELMGTTVWTGVEQLDLSFGDDPQKISSGFSRMLEVDKDIEKEVSQFYIRFVENELKQEKVLRLVNGFPTTKRESDAFDAQQARDALAKEAYVRGLMRFAERKLNIKDDRKATAGGRNDPCHCGSGKKRKKCCGDWKTGRPDPRPELKLLAELQRSNAVDPAALLKRAREGDLDPKALHVDDLNIGDTVVSGHTIGRGKPGDLVCVTVNDSLVGTCVVDPDGAFRLEGLEPLQVGKIVEAKLADDSDMAAADPIAKAESMIEELKLQIPTKAPLLALAKAS